MLEKLCLKWNDFQNNINTAVESLRDNSDFADVTLVSEDGQQVAAHKVILTNTNTNTNRNTNANTNSQIQMLASNPRYLALIEWSKSQFKILDLEIFWKHFCKALPR